MASRTLIPQYSIRWLLAVMVGCALVFSIFALARREYLAGYDQGCWAIGVSIAIVSLLGVLLIHALLFGVVWAFAEVMVLLPLRHHRTGQSPFQPAHSPRTGPAPYVGQYGTPPDEPASNQSVLPEKEGPVTPIILD